VGIAVPCQLHGARDKRPKAHASIGLPASLGRKDTMHIVSAALAYFFFGFLITVYPSLQAVAQSPDHGSTRYHFDVLLNDKVIGEHSFTLTHLSEDIQTVEGAADYRVKFFGVEVFRYQHQHKERWEDGCLSDYEARTETGRELTITTVESSPERYVVTSNSGNQVHARTDAPCLWSYAYWRPELSAQKSLINGQTGELSAVSIRLLDNSVNNKAIYQRIEIARHSDDEAPIIVLYDRQGRWVGLEVQLAKNRQLLYRRRD